MEFPYFCLEILYIKMIINYWIVFIIIILGVKLG